MCRKENNGTLATNFKRFKLKKNNDANLGITRSTTTGTSNYFVGNLHRVYDLKTIIDWEVGTVHGIFNRLKTVKLLAFAGTRTIFLVDYVVLVPYVLYHNKRKILTVQSDHRKKSTRRSKTTNGTYSTARARARYEQNGPRPREYGEYEV